MHETRTKAEPGSGPAKDKAPSVRAERFVMLPEGCNVSHICSSCPIPGEEDGVTDEAARAYPLRMGGGKKKMRRHPKKATLF